MSFHLDEDKEVPTIMANFTCYTGNCTLMTTTEMLQVAGSSGLVTTETSPAASELEPYTNLQASLIGKDHYEKKSTKLV